MPKLRTFLVASTVLDASESRIIGVVSYLLEEAEGFEQSEANGGSFHLDRTSLEAAESLIDYPKSGTGSHSFSLLRLSRGR